MPSRLECLKRLNKEADGLWYGESSGYGVSSSAYLLTDEGVYGGVSVTDSPISMTQEEYDEAVAEINNNDSIDFEELSYDDAIKMVKADCKPGVEYHHDPCYDDEYEYEEFDEYISFILCDSDFLTLWEDMSDEELEHWCEVLDYIKKGYKSFYEINCNKPTTK